jgi:hypothetical protein
MNSKEEKEKPQQLNVDSEDFEKAARILSSLIIEGISLSSESLRLMLERAFSNLSETQINELIKTFSKNGENNNE